MNIKIIGNGVWGNAIYSVVKRNCPTVSIVKRKEKIVDWDVIILSVPTQSIRESIANISSNQKHGVIVNTSKGIEKSSHLLPYQIVRSVFGDDVDYYTLIGPSHAKEVVEKVPTLVNLGYAKKGANNKTIRNLFQTNFFRVKLTAGVEILELAGAFKNIYAIASGIAYGLDFGANTRAKIIVLAIDEMNKLFKALNLRNDSSKTCGTIGDLILTCNLTESRNFTFGELLTKYNVEESLSKIKSTVEGYYSVFSLKHFEKRANMKLPLANFILSVVKMDNPKKIKRQFERFLSLI